MCFWEAQMPWRSPCNNNRDRSQLWMVLVDFSSNKNHESFHNFWNCKEITTVWLGGGERDTLWSTKSSKLKRASFFCLLRSCTLSVWLMVEERYQVSVLVPGSPLVQCSLWLPTVQPPSLHVSLRALGPKHYFMCAPTFYGSKNKRRRIEWGTCGRPEVSVIDPVTPFCRTAFSVGCRVLLLAGGQMKFSEGQNQSQLLTFDGLWGTIRTSGLSKAEWVQVRSSFLSSYSRKA